MIIPTLNIIIINYVILKYVSSYIKKLYIIKNIYNEREMNVVLYFRMRK